MRIIIGAKAKRIARKEKFILSLLRDGYFRDAQAELANLEILRRKA